jgi:hypothetical protein
MPAVIAFVLDFVRDAAPPFVQVARQSIKSLTCAVVFARSVISKYQNRTDPARLRICQPYIAAYQFRLLITLI